MKNLLFAILTLSAVSVQAQTETSWTAQQCMKYAVEHNTQVHRAVLQLDNYKAQKTSAIGSFLPSVDASIGANYNFGRAIDPETNGYTNVSTFYNGYSVQAYLPVFDGFSRLNALKAAKASLLMGRNALREQQDKTALTTLQAWVDVVYYDKMVEIAQENQQETELLLKQTQVLVEVGRKSAADLAQIEAQHAESAYELTCQQNRYASALLTLKRQMAYPLQDSLFTVVSTLRTACPNVGTSSGTAFHPMVQQQYHAMQVSRYELNQARAGLYPTLSLSAGLSTTFYKTLHSQNTSSFSEQIKNNKGEYVSATLSIPLFNRLQTISNIRRAKNDYQMARESFEDTQRELEKLNIEACQDLNAYILQTQQMEKKVEADSLSYQLTRRRYEEGLSTAIDLHATATQLLKSKATLMQCQLMTVVKEYFVRYYQGEQIRTE